MLQNVDHLVVKAKTITSAAVSRTSLSIVEELRKENMISIYSIYNLMSAMSSTLENHVLHYEHLEVESMKNKLNEDYVYIKYLNEIKLKRYGFAELPYFGKTNIMTVGGVTVLNSDRTDFYFNFNDEFAIELEDFELKDGKVSDLFFNLSLISNLRTTTRLVLCCGRKNFLML